MSKQEGGGGGKNAHSVAAYPVLFFGNKGA